jgi:hypothetical protein
MQKYYISNLRQMNVKEILNFPFICVVNFFKNHTNKIFDVWSKLIKQPISTWVTIITASKNKTTREERKKHKRICLPLGRE